MCCRRRHNRAPLLVVLGKKVYEKYQERQAVKQIERRHICHGPFTIEQDSLSFVANREILEKAGINPPSYNEVVINHRAIISDEQRPPLNVKVGWVTVDGEKDVDELAAPEDVFYDVSNGMRQLDLGSTASQAAPMLVKEVYRSKCEQRRAERNARRAERRSVRGGCC
ncbi:hypothetical protein LTR78_002182 [Recurvomyces mirabilis]|uniref:Uncharacterized protein n=1 Tax=Recurvomyces mirabilis TaxID=574656 RepID=A0AAE0WUJ5_9PEZI|nr:hypothetical protein LTR78_002182 [Recurvomyces mirabilis]KAK5160639.1 hypothetical protein LTS14_001651 [Recurvomyces mirabilis]